MEFKVGDKVKPTKKLLSWLSIHTINMIKDGGVVIEILPYAIRIKFYSNNEIFQLNSCDLEKYPVKNQQLLFNFME